MTAGTTRTCQGGQLATVWHLEHAATPFSAACPVQMAYCTAACPVQMAYCTAACPVQLAYCTAACPVQMAWFFSCPWILELLATTDYVHRDSLVFRITN